MAREDHDIYKKSVYQPGMGPMRIDACRRCGQTWHGLSGPCEPVVKQPDIEPQTSITTERPVYHGVDTRKG